MATISFTMPAGSFSAGASVAAYPASAWPGSQWPPSSTPTSSATQTITAAGDGSVAFTALAPQSPYVATDGTVYVRFSTGAPIIASDAWNGSHLTMGSYHLWVDATGRLRAKNGTPSSDTDGSIVGAEQFYRTIYAGRGRLDALAAVTTALGESGGASVAGTSGTSPFWFDPADYTVTGASVKLRLRAEIDTNNTAPASNFTFGMYAVSAPAGAAAALSYTLGAAATGSAVTITTPAANSINHSETADFTPPVAGLYTMGLVVVSNMAANSSARARATLQVRHV